MSILVHSTIVSGMASECLGAPQHGTSPDDASLLSAGCHSIPIQGFEIPWLPDCNKQAMGRLPLVELLIVKRAIDLGIDTTLLVTGDALEVSRGVRGMSSAGAKYAISRRVPQVVSMVFNLEPLLNAVSNVLVVDEGRRALYCAIANWKIRK